MPRIRERLFESPGLFSLERGPVRVDLSAAGARTAHGADRGMLNLSVHARYDCGWVSIYEAPTRFPVLELVGEGKRALRYLMDQLHGSVASGDHSRLRLLAPRMRLMRPGNLLSAAGVASDDALVADEQERLRCLRDGVPQQPGPELAATGGLHP